MIVYQLELKSKFRFMCEGGIYVFITHFIEYVVGVGVVERLNHSVLMLT